MDRLEFSRRALLAGATVVAATAAPNPAAAADATPAAAPVPPGLYEAVTYTFDANAFAAVLDRPFPHRQVVAATTFGEGIASFAFMRNTINAYVDPIYFNAGPKSVHAAAVFYHGASVLLAVDDAMWAKYPLADLTVAPGTTPKPDAKPVHANEHAADLNGLVATYGASFFVCNNALSGFAGLLATKLAPAGTAATRDQVVAIHTELVAHFLPGVMLVPAGVAAINAAQEARFTFLRA
jgi:intracellular sulfur oxidation DsrE/DsrF family protein